MTESVISTYIDDTATVTLQAPQRANALSPELVDALGKAIEQAASRETRALVLRSSGQVFCSGFDLSNATEYGGAALARRFVALESLLDAVAGAPMMTIACIEGPAVGAGADLAVACDYRIGTDRAQFRFPGARFGLVLGTHRLTGVVGGAAARDLLLGQQVAQAPEAQRLGLLSRLVPGNLIDATVSGLIQSSRSLDLPTMRSILSITRDPARESPMAALLASLAAPTLVDRLRSYHDNQQASRKDRAG